MTTNLRSLLVFNADKTFNAAQTGRALYALINAEEKEVNPQLLVALHAVLDYSPGVRQSRATIVQAMILKLNELSGNPISQGSISKMQKEINEFLTQNIGDATSGKLLSTRKGQKGGICRWSEASDIPTVTAATPAVTVAETPVAPVPVASDVAALIANVVAATSAEVPTSAPEVDADEGAAEQNELVTAADDSADVPDFVVDENEEETQEVSEEEEEEELDEMADDSAAE